MSLRKQQNIFASQVAALIVEANRQGYEVSLGEAERPIEMQRIHMAAGRSTTMNSMHLKRCAIDLHFFDSTGQLCYPAGLGAFWESLDPANRWGGNWQSFKDMPHFERKV
jgi:hypothetical protein